MDNPGFDIICGDSREELAYMPENHFHGCITDPPYGLNAKIDAAQILSSWLSGVEPPSKGSGFMGHAWDSIVPSPALWKEVLRVLKPGAHVAVFSGTRTIDLMGISLRLAGFEYRDTIFGWTYGEGMPKGGDLSIQVDKTLGAAREVVGVRKGTGNQRLCGEGEGKGFKSTVTVTRTATDAAKSWEGWSTTLKPTVEPILLFRKPISESTVAKNLLKHGAGGINVGKCKVGDAKIKTCGRFSEVRQVFNPMHSKDGYEGNTHEGRWPGNTLLFHDESCGDECGEGCSVKEMADQYPAASDYFSQFYYGKKPKNKERDFGMNGERNNHPCVKPISVLQWLVDLIIPPDGLLIDPFCGSGSTGMAAMSRGIDFTGIDIDPTYVEWANRRIEAMRTAGLDLNA